MNKNELISRIKRALTWGSVLITGPSGVGKSKFLDELPFPQAIKIHMDEYGHKQGDKWITKFDELPMEKEVVNTRLIYEGYGTNYLELASKIPIKLVILVRPNPDLFRVIQTFKAADHLSTSKHVVKSWVEGWLRKAVMTNEEVTAYFKEKDAPIRKLFKPNEVEVYLTEKSGEVERGWHKNKTI